MIWYQKGSGLLAAVAWGLWASLLAMIFFDRVEPTIGRWTIILLVLIVAVFSSFMTAYGPRKKEDG